MIRVRPANPDDAGEILTVQRAAFVIEAQAHQDPHLPPLTESLAEVRAAIEAGQVIVACSGRRLIGCVRRHLSGSTVQIARLAVAPDRQGEGVGSTLLAAAEDVQGASAATLFTGDLSASNLRLYRSRGYLEIGRTPAGTHHLVHLRKSLDQAPQP